MHTAESATQVKLVGGMPRHAPNHGAISYAMVAISLVVMMRVESNNNMRSGIQEPIA